MSSVVVVGMGVVVGTGMVGGVPYLPGSVSAKVCKINAHNSKSGTANLGRLQLPNNYILFFIFFILQNKLFTHPKLGVALLEYKDYVYMSVN